MIQTLNDLFHNIKWMDQDKIRRLITEEVTTRVAQNRAYQHSQANSDKQNAALEHGQGVQPGGAGSAF